MKLRTSVQINALFPIILAVLVSVGLMVRSMAVDHTRTGVALAEELAERVADLTLLVGRGLAREEAGGLRGSIPACDSLLGFLQAGDLTVSGGGDVVKRIAARVETLKLAIGKLESLPVDGPGAADRERLRQSVHDNLRNLAVAGARAGRNADNEAASVEYLVDRMFIGVIGAAALVMAILTLLASRSVIKRMQGLKDVCDRVSDANMGVQLDVQPGEEMEASYHSFNTMIGRLQKSFILLREERERLRGEMEKCKSSAEAGRQANIHLADALARLKRAQDEIVMQERVRALEQIVVGVSRDFDTMLVPIITTSDYLLAYPEHLSDMEDVQSNLKEINRVAREANKRVRLLSEIFRSPSAPESHAVDLGKAVDKALQISEERLRRVAEERRVEYSVDVEMRELDPVEGDEVDVVETLHELIVNAAEAMIRGGVVRIRGRNEAGKVILEVLDAGEGMGPEVKQRCLEPFFSTKGGGHRGMGLATVVASVGRFGGTVDIETTPGAGTNVRLTLARYTEKPVAVVEKAATVSRMKILVVDDEDWARRLMSRILLAEKHSVETVSGAEEGLRRIEEKTFDLVILDRAMPNMSGDEMAVRLRDGHPGIPIVLVSGLGDMMIKSGERPVGVDVILSKPFSVEELRQAIARAVQAKGSRRTFSGVRKPKADGAKAKIQKGLESGGGSV